MSIYLEYEVNCLSDHIIDIRLHEKLRYLAVISCHDETGGCLSIHDTQGNAIPKCDVVKPKTVPTCVAWHPGRALCCVGWKSGEVDVWNQEERQLFSLPHSHKYDITGVCWTGHGNRIATADKRGLLYVWKVDVRGRVQQQAGGPAVEQQMGGEIRSLILMPSPVKDKDALDISVLAKAAVGGDEQALDLLSWKGRGLKFTGVGVDEAMNFFIGLQTGHIYLLDGHGGCRKMSEATGGVVQMLYNARLRMLVAVTDAGFLCHFVVSEDGLPGEVFNVKLANRCAAPRLCWAGASCLAMALTESAVRMWDIDAGDNYSLPLANNAMQYDPNAKINTVAYCESRKTLVAGTQLGQLVFWQWNPISPSGMDSQLMSSSSAAAAGLVPGLNDSGATAEPAEQWQLQCGTAIQGNISSVCWGTDTSLLAVCGVAMRAYVFHPHPLNYDYCSQGQLAVAQLSTSNIALSKYSTQQFTLRTLKLPIRLMATSAELLATWNGLEVSVFEMGDEKEFIRQIASFAYLSPILAVAEQNIYTSEPLKIQVRNSKGTVKQLLALNEVEGNVRHLCVNGKFLVCASERNYLRVYDLSRREAKEHVTAKNINEFVPNVRHIESVACNSDGSVVSVVVMNHDGKINPRLFAWETQSDTMQFFNFHTGMGELQEYSMKLSQKKQADKGQTKSKSVPTWLQGEAREADNSSAADGDFMSISEAAKEISNRYPASHMWDCTDPRLVVVEAKLVSNVELFPTEVEQHALLANNMIVSLFLTQENGLLMQDSFSLHASHRCLMAVDVPFYYFTVRPDIAMQKASEQEEALDHKGEKCSHFMARRVMRDFVGLEDTTDKSSREAMMNFSYFLTLGNMDEAYRAMKLIKSSSVWLNMAKMCVKTRRLDVAMVCLGKMSDARGAMLLRETIAREPEVNSQVAVLAIHLNMMEEAERLLRNSHRYDMLNRLYQSLGHWNKALKLAETVDRIHLRSTHYNYAKYLESRQDVNGAIEHFIKSETYHFEVPRLLCENMIALENFIHGHPEKSLLKWWAQYMESVGEMQTALKFYSAADDFLSLVRVHCYLGEDDKAEEICADTGDKASCYHLARQLESAGNIDKAIHFFTRSAAYSSAIRLCKEHERCDHLVNLALLAKPDEMIDAAQFLERRTGYEDRAVMLYHKAGYLSRAVDLAFRSRQFAALQDISRDLNEFTDPLLMRQCAEFFLSNQQYDRAVDIMATSKQFWEAVKLCSEYHVPITEDLAERLTPLKPTAAAVQSSSNAAAQHNDSPVAAVPAHSSDGGMRETERVRLLEAIADLAMTQGSYHIACKKYTQAGNPVAGMKALLKSGDTEKIIFFANVSKRKETYLMAGNYLQSLNWSNDAEIMKHIIQFYTKARAMDLLANFYEACSQVEVDEFHNYEKAIGALSEAYKCMCKAKLPNETQQDARINQLKDRIVLMKRYLAAQLVLHENPDEGLKQLQNLLEEPQLNETVRVGDVYASMVRQFIKQDKFKAAYACYEEMKRRLQGRASVTIYLEAALIHRMHQALGLVSADSGSQARRQAQQPSNDEEVDEVIDGY